MIVVSAVLELNINPRDELARQSETTEIGERGGVVVDDQRLKKVSMQLEK
jgi:hypothetical protein